ncbi:MAG: alpha-galactosidase [Ruminococcaceae bacterium]|nr:alpha-galactosidase [Oscillospiraceae bacterium]
MEFSPVLYRYIAGDMELAYLITQDGHVGLRMIPTSLAHELQDGNGFSENLVQLHIRGDHLPEGALNGCTLAWGASSWGFVYQNQSVESDNGITVIRTTLMNDRGHRAVHILTHREGARAVSVQTVFENGSEAPVTLELLTAFSLGGLTPFGGKGETDRMKLHRARSWWSAEGRMVTEVLEDMHLERSWTGHGGRVEKFGQIGSLPVRGYFPFAALEDTAAGATWAFQVGCPSSWQMELRRSADRLAISGGVADFDFGHWSKTLQPGDTLESPVAYLTVGTGGLDAVSQRLLDLHSTCDIMEGDALPVVFNEFCTTWGNPSEENIARILDKLRGRGVDYFVIDCGWFGNGNWVRDIGDWTLNESMFPSGLQTTVQRICDAGIKPGIWFEAENCAPGSRMSKRSELMLHRNGTPIFTGRYFLNLSLPEVRDYLRERVMDFLKEYGFRYIKIDYNDSIGVGCDHPDGLGEGLRQNMLATQDLFAELRREVPGLVIENCASGGHRLEPSMMELCDMASFSDAHECVHIPIIAANLHRLIAPSKSQIWAVLRKNDSLRRLNYSLVNTLLGVMCLSGDVYDLSDEQWSRVDRAIRFYKRYSPIIKRGVSSFYGVTNVSYLEPEGWQAVSRYDEETGETLLVVHTFGGRLPERVRIPVNAEAVADILCTEGNSVVLADGFAEVEIKANFEALAIALN